MNYPEKVQTRQISDIMQSFAEVLERLVLSEEIRKDVEVAYERMKREDSAKVSTISATNTVSEIDVISGVAKDSESNVTLEITYRHQTEYIICERKIGEMINQCFIDLKDYVEICSIDGGDPEFIMGNRIGLRLIEGEVKMVEEKCIGGVYRSKTKWNDKRYTDVFDSVMLYSAYFVFNRIFKLCKHMSAKNEIKKVTFYEAGYNDDDEESCYNQIFTYTFKTPVKITNNVKYLWVDFRPTFEEAIEFFDFFNKMMENDIYICDKYYHAVTTIN